MTNKLLFFLLLFSFEANASDVSKGIIQKVLSSFKNFEKLASDFEQTDSQGNMATGKFVVDKLKFRCNYYAPHPLLVIGNEYYVSVYDYEMRQLSRQSSSENMFYLLLSNNLDMNKFVVEESQETKDRYILVVSSSEFESKSQLVVNKGNMNMESLSIVNNDNIIYINFFNWEKIYDIDEKLFSIPNPNLFGPPQRLDAENIERFYKK